MITKSNAIRENIFTIAKTEFMEKGFMDASMRTIAERAGYTTAMLYSRLADKDQIFCALVEEGGSILYDYFVDAQETFAAYEPERQKNNMHAYVDQKVDHMIDILYEHLGRYGWMAVLFAVLSMLIYMGGLLCSHLAAFRVQANIRKQLVHHIATLPLGFMDSAGSGKLRKIIDESSAATETYLAHQLPDKAGALTTPAGLLVMLLGFDWRLGLLRLLPVGIAFAIMGAMTGKRMAKKMKEYQDSLELMASEAVEYVRGIPVVKTFGQSVFSFKRFQTSIDNYQKWVISYTKDLRLPMMFYTIIINAVFAVLIAAALYFTVDGVSNEFLLNLLFYIIITPVITVMLHKIMYLSENKMIVTDALQRIDGILALQPLLASAVPETPKDNAITLRNVVFCYPNASQNALDGIRMEIKPGEHVALVGPSDVG